MTFYQAASPRAIEAAIRPPPACYIQEGMATDSNKIAAQPKAQQGLVYLPLIAGWLFPGAGHFLLRKWGRGALLAVSIIGLFATGLAMKGRIYTGAQDILDMLGMAGDLGNGLLYVAGRAFGWGADQVQVTTADYGTKFIVVAGLLNIIAAVDAHNLSTGRKPQ
jgi:hypothetical protein